MPVAIARAVEQLLRNALGADRHWAWRRFIAAFFIRSAADRNLFLLGRPRPFELRAIGSEMTRWCLGSCNRSA